MSITNPFTKDDLLFGIEKLRVRYSESNEVIPNYTEKEVDELFNCINRVYQGYYETREERLCNIVYNITKGHYLSNGNKRVAVMVTFVIYWIEVFKSQKIPEYIINKLSKFIKIIVLKVANGSMTKEELLLEVKNHLLQNKYKL